MIEVPFSILEEYFLQNLLFCEVEFVFKFLFENVKNSGENVIVINENIALVFFISVVLNLKNQYFFIFVLVLTFHVLYRWEKNCVALSFILNKVQELKIHVFPVFVGEGDDLDFLFCWGTNVLFVCHCDSPFKLTCQPGCHIC